MSSARDHADMLKSAAVRPLISRSTILIIGGLLVGLTMSSAVHAGISSQLFLTGALGIVAYLGLSCVASIRHRHAIQRRRDQSISQLEARVDHHLHGE